MNGARRASFSRSTSRVDKHGAVTAKPSGRLVIQGLFALLVTAVALWWAFHDADLDAMRTTFAESSPWIIGGFFFGQIALHALRILRVGLFIRPITPSISARAIFAAANLGIAATFLIPLRLGEFVRPMLLQRSGVPFGSAVSSVVVERIADGLCAVGLFFVFVGYVPMSDLDPKDAQSLRTASQLASLIFGSALVFLVAAALAREPVLGLTRNLIGRISPTLADRIVGLIATFLDGLSALGSAWRSGAFIILTVAYWVGSGLLIWMLAYSYDDQLPLVAGLFCVSVLVFMVMIPAGPGFAGTFQAGFKLGFLAFGLGASEIAVIAVIAHVMQLLAMGLFVGAGAMAAEPEQLGRRVSPEVNPG